MGKIPQNLRETIAHNIRECRIRVFSGRGGAKKCAEAFGVSPQQWSPWERGKRTPDEIRLQQIADFFGVTVEYLRHDNSKPAEEIPAGNIQDNNLTQTDTSSSINPFTTLIAGMPPLDSPGSPASFFQLARHLAHHIMTEGITVRLNDGTITLVIGTGQKQP